MQFNLAVIGGGPAGYTAAERAAAAGKSVVLFEKQSLGGVCLNEGCIPTKTLLYSAKLYDNFKSASKYGITLEAAPVADMSKIAARKTKVVRKLVAGIKARMNEHRVAVVNGNAEISEVNENGIKICCNNETFEADYLIICAGSETVIPPIPGLEGSTYWSSTEALLCKELPASLIVMGGGVIGMEFASFFNSMGTAVTIVEMAPEILGGIDSELAALLRAEYEKRGVTFYLSSRVTAVNAGGVSVDTGTETLTLNAEKLLVSVGRRASLKGLGLEVTGIEYTPRGICVSKQMQTSHPRIFACGDITGYSLLAHTAVREAEVAVNTLLGQPDAMCYNAIPGVVYTNPEVAGIGYTEEQLKAESIEHKVLKLPMSFSGRFVAENEGGNGICKVITDTDNRVIGTHILGNPASEVIALSAMAITQRLTLEEWKKTVFPHPSVSEIIKECISL